MVELLTVSKEAALWMAIGFVFARAFGKQMDQGVQTTAWFNGLKDWQKGLVSRLLDFGHHWWMGLLLWFYAPSMTLPTGFDAPLQFLGLGWFIDDLPDVPPRFRKFFSYFLPLTENGEKNGDATRR